jgi:aminoglycoside N3'-acetyltransferase
MDLLNDLRALGVRPGDLVMVHASLRRLGLPRPDGAQRLLDALDAAVGPDGTLLMVLGTEAPSEFANALPVAERAAALVGTPGVDLATAPALAEVGAFAEFFREAPGTRISDNPNARFAARGPAADDLFRDAPWHDYYGPGSPLDRLVQRGGKVLRLGANPDTVTVLHFAEYLADVADKRRVRWDYVVATPDGPRHVWVEGLDDAEGIVDWDGPDYFAAILEAWLATGAGARGRVGAAAAELLDAGALVAFGAAWMAENLGRARGGG